MAIASSAFGGNLKVRRFNGAYPAVEKSISKVLELTGSIIATRVAKMGSPAEGPVAECRVREGDKVSTGQVLLSIGRKKAADALVKAAEAYLTREQEDLKRIDKLVRGGAIAAEELETARLRVSSAVAERAKALESIGDYQIESPLNGVVSKVFVTDGYYVAPREALVEIYDPGSMVVRFAVPESKVAAVQKGMPVEVKLDAYPGQEFKGVIERVYPELNLQTRTRTAEAGVIQNDGILLLPGMFARMRIGLESVENAVLIPDRAVTLSTENEPTAFVVMENKVTARRLTLGIEEELVVQVLEGIKSGEMVVVEGNERLKNGVSVRIVGSESKAEHALGGKK